MKKTLIPIFILAAGLASLQAREIPVANPASLQPALASASVRPVSAGQIAVSQMDRRKINVDFMVFPWVGGG